MTLVSTAGRSECTRILCSVTASTSMVTAFSGPRFCSSVENLPPLREGEKHSAVGRHMSFRFDRRLPPAGGYLSGSGEETGWLSIRLS